MDAMRRAVVLLLVAAVAVLLGGVLQYVGQRLAAREALPDASGLRRLALALYVDAGVLAAAAGYFYLLR